MQVAARLILEEGLASRFRRHEVAAAALRDGLGALGLEMFPDPTIVSSTVSCVKTPKEIDIRLLEGPQQGESFVGIYLVRKDEIRICLRLEGTQFGRPKGYVTTSGTTLYAFILEPVDAKPAAPPIRAKEPAPAP